MNKKISFKNGRTISKTDKPFIIAEIGSNHNQDINIAKELIDVSVEAGADAVKFQSLSVKELYHEPDENTYRLHKKIDFEESWHYILADYCKNKNIIFFSTPTYLKSIDILEEIDIPLYKLASAQAGTFPYLVDKVASLQKPVLVSTGISSYSNLEKVYNIFKNNKNDNLIILHCNSVYPTPYNRVDLEKISLYSKMFDCLTGYSDHTLNNYITYAAVARGACVIERHITMSREFGVPDASFSILPEELKELVVGTNAVFQALNTTPRNCLLTEESSFKENVKYKLVLKNKKLKGDHFNESDFIFKRSKEGIDSIYMDLIIGKFGLSKNKDENSILNWSDLTGF